jgi:hypothetical protein
MSVSIFSWKRKRKDVTNPMDWSFLMDPSDSVFPLPFPPGNMDGFTCGCFSLRRWMKYHSCLKYFSTSSMNDSRALLSFQCFHLNEFTYRQMSQSDNVHFTMKVSTRKMFWCQFLSHNTRTVKCIYSHLPHSTNETTNITKHNANTTPYS